MLRAGSEDALESELILSNREKRHIHGMGAFVFHCAQKNKDHILLIRWE